METTREVVRAVTPKLFAVVQDSSRVVARGLTADAAAGFVKAWKSFDRDAVIVEESIAWPTDDQVLGQLPQAP